MCDTLQDYRAEQSRQLALKLWQVDRRKALDNLFTPALKQVSTSGQPKENTYA
jgi:hypothetical protein